MNARLSAEGAAARRLRALSVAPGVNDAIRPGRAPLETCAAGFCRLVDTLSCCWLDRSVASLASFAGCEAAPSRFRLDSDGSSFASSMFCGAGRDSTSPDSATDALPGAVHTPYAVNE